MHTISFGLQSRPPVPYRCVVVLVSVLQLLDLVLLVLLPVVLVPVLVAGRQGSG